MTTRRTWRRLAALRPGIAASLVAITLAACGVAGQAPASPPGPTIDKTTVPPSTPSPSAPGTDARGTLIVRVTIEGGFIKPTAVLAAIPAFSAYDDGRIMTPAPITEIFPGRLMPAVSVRSVGRAGATAIVAAIRAAGLDKPAVGKDPGAPGDTGTTVVTVNLGGATTVTRLAGQGAPGAGDPSDAAARAFVTKLSDSSATWGAGSAPESILIPAGYRVFVVPGAPEAGDPSLTQHPVAWPLATPLDRFGSSADPDHGLEGLRVSDVSGNDAAILRGIFDQATELTPFTSGGKSYSLYVRPLLPDELPG
ncbi:MAG TPA: hypothetical protein VIM30_02320 [Candidatus Limnocylindrales bacterium]|jgi:hypothetical protein